VLFYVDGLYRETVVFEIEYEMYNAALRYGDSSELYISFYSEETINYLKSWKGQVLIPNEIMPRAGNYFANTFGTNANTFPFKESTTINPGYHTFIFELDESQLKFRKYNEYIEFTLVAYGEDKHIFTQHASQNAYYSASVLPAIEEELAEYLATPGRWMLVKLLVFAGAAAVAALTILLAVQAIKGVRKKYTFYEPSMQMEYFREIPSEVDPCFAAALIQCKHKGSYNVEDGFSAVVLSLVRKKYIELERIKSTKGWDFSNMQINVKYNPFDKAQPLYANNPTQPFNPYNYTNPETPENPYNYFVGLKQENTPEPEYLPDMLRLTPTEEQYLILIIRHSRGKTISFSAFQKQVSLDYQHTNSLINKIKKAITDIGVTEGYYQKADFKEPKRKFQSSPRFLGVVGGLILVFANLISSSTRLDLAFGAFFVIGLAFIGSGVYLHQASKKLVLLTQFGEDEYAKWRGLYNFLNSETLMNERTVVELAVWERYLIAATAFGISAKVIKALNVRCPNAEESPVLRNPYCRSVRFHTSTSRSFSSASSSASFTARSGGHGGYGGGGRGGGGGGGGH
jgi:hypothetical protein